MSSTTAVCRPREPPRGPPRPGALRLDRPTLRLAVGIASLVAALFAGGLAVLTAHHTRQLLEAGRRAAEDRSLALALALRRPVREADGPRTAGILADVGRQPGVLRAMIVDGRGAVLTSSEPDVQGGPPPAADERSTRRTALPIEGRDGSALTLVLDVSLADVLAELRRDAAWLAAGTAAVAVAALCGAGLLARRLATEARDRERELGSVVNSLDDGLVVLDERFLVLAVNDAFCRRAGTSPDALRGRRCREAIPAGLPCLGAEPRCPSARCLATGEGQRATFRVPPGGAQGSRVEEVHASPIRDGSGRVVRVVEVWRDITERAEDEERLAELEHLSSLGALASGFAHEVSTPLASSLVSAESIVARLDEAGVAPPDAACVAFVRRSAETIRSQVLRCRTITEQFRRFSRGIPPSIEPLDVRATVAGVIALVAPTAGEARAEVVLEEGEPAPPVRANAEVLQHVLLNLLVNAIQSLGDGGGRISVAVRSGPDVRLVVRDDGCGIAADLRPRLFEPFRSRKRGGTGLGLFLSRRFMRRFGGDVRLVESTVGVGSCFEVSLARAGGGA